MATDPNPAGAGADPLEALSSEELHKLAVSHAAHHLNVKFFWRLMSSCRRPRRRPASSTRRSPTRAACGAGSTT